MGQIDREVATTWHRALADESRARIVDELGGEPDGLDAHELGRRLDLHPNTVRWHVGLLADAGIVAARRAERTTPGRPRTIYSLSSRAGVSGTDEFRLLASALTTALSRRDDAPALSDAAGRSWGRYLAPRRPPTAPADEGEIVGEIVALLDEQGFAPEVLDGELHLHRCPFSDLAEQHPEIVCSVHKGLIAGAVEELGSELEVELAPFVEPNLCIVRLRSGS